MPFYMCRVISQYISLQRLVIIRTVFLHQMCAGFMC